MLEGGCVVCIHNSIYPVSDKKLDKQTEEQKTQAFGN